MARKIRRGTRRKVARCKPVKMRPVTMVKVGAYNQKYSPIQVNWMTDGLPGVTVGRHLDGTLQLVRPRRSRTMDIFQAAPGDTARRRRGGTFTIGARHRPQTFSYLIQVGDPAGRRRGTRGKDAAVSLGTQWGTVGYHRRGEGRPIARRPGMYTFGPK